MKFILFICRLLVVKVFEMKIIVPRWLMPAKEKPIFFALECKPHDVGSCMDTAQ